MLQAPQWGAESFVTLTVTHSNLNARFPEIKFPLEITVAQLKFKLSQRCGTAPSSMKVSLEDEGGGKVSDLSDDSLALYFYTPQDGWTLHVTDLDPSSASARGELEDLSRVEKYVMPDEVYAKRENNFRQFRKKMEACGKIKENRKETREDEVSHLTAGSRCQVVPGDKRGEIRYIGEVQGLPSGNWVGVAFDEPVGKNDGSFQGVTYFECEPRFGGFARPEKVSTGDYPPIDPFDEDIGDI